MALSVGMFLRSHPLRLIHLESPEYRLLGHFANTHTSPPLSNGASEMLREARGEVKSASASYVVGHALKFRSVSN